uniref:Uncharacterized protein n=1 Tax=Anguilla anguilla TaxID=7936 RepID=A0A0E9PBJ1_ANGAN
MKFRTYKLRNIKFVNVLRKYQGINLRHSGIVLYISATL